jgi:hypothetical protein
VLSRTGAAMVGSFEVTTLCRRGRGIPSSSRHRMWCRSHQRSPREGYVLVFVSHRIIYKCRDAKCSLHLGVF